MPAGQSASSQNENTGRHKCRPPHWPRQMPPSAYAERARCFIKCHN